MIAILPAANGDAEVLLRSKHDGDPRIQSACPDTRASSQHSPEMSQYDANH